MWIFVFQPACIMTTIYFWLGHGSGNDQRLVREDMGSSGDQPRCKLSTKHLSYVVPTASDQEETFAYYFSLVIPLVCLSAFPELACIALRSGVNASFQYFNLQERAEVVFQSVCGSKAGEITHGLEINSFDAITETKTSYAHKCKLFVDFNFIVRVT